MMAEREKEISGYQGRRLHIVSFDVPTPPDYGGVIDVFYKIKALSEAGVKIHLHAFTYGRGSTPELEQLCETVSLYRRNTSPVLHLSGKPYIVASRMPATILHELGKDTDPVLLEGIHCTGFLGHKDISNKRLIVRTHNIEHHYYQGLAASERNYWKRNFFKREARKLKRWERILVKSSAIAAISENDRSHLSQYHADTATISAFHANERVNVRTGRGTYALYHGNLAVSENDFAARWLVTEVFSGLDVPLLIVGRNPSASLRETITKHIGVRLVDDPSSDQIHQFISDAQMNVLPTFQSTGIKLKLLAALYQGRHCITNLDMVRGTGLEELCTVCNDAEEMQKFIAEAWHKPLDDEAVAKRKSVLEDGLFSNKANVQRLLGLIYP